MSKEKSNLKTGKLIQTTLVFLFVLALFSSCFTIYEIYLLDSIENILRYIVIGFLILLDILFFFKIRKYRKESKKAKKGLFAFLIILYTLICLAIGGIIYYVYGQIDHLNKNTVTYTSNLLVMSNSAINKIQDIRNMEIGILADKKNPEGYIIPQEIIKEQKLQDENEIKEYDDYTTMLVDLYSNELDAMFVSNSYVSMFSNITGYENIETDTKVIISKDKEMRKASTSKIETASAGKSVTEPFTILLMGIDSTDEVLTKNAIANGDTLILITFNPKTLNATMLSIPRDSYVPIACWSGQPENKITHAAAYGNDCMINTIQNYFDTKIDYYAKINFKGLVKLVEAVGGVEVNVTQRLCTDDSSREGMVCIEEGYQKLNGEQALVYARNRKALANGDFGRAAHQQEIVMALINKMKGMTEVSTFVNILNTISNSMDTNLTTKQILSFYNVGKDIVKKSLSSNEANLVNVQQLYLQGVGQMIYDERAKLVLWDYIPNQSSRKDIIQAMKENLELVEHKNITEFHFSINEPYQKTIIGEGPYNNNSSYNLLPDFTGDTKEQAETTANKLGLSVSFIGNYGTVIDQSYPARKRIDLIKDKLIFTLSGNSNSKQDDDEDNKEETAKETEKEKEKEKEEEKKEEEKPIEEPEKKEENPIEEQSKEENNSPDE